MTVQFDEATSTWRVVHYDGTLRADGFATNAAAWAWIDAHGNDVREDVQDRIRDAIRRW